MRDVLHIWRKDGIGQVKKDLVGRGGGNGRTRKESGKLEGGEGSRGKTYRKKKTK